MNIGDKVYLKENARVILGLPDDIEYTIIDILGNYVDYPIVLSAEELGKDWVEFFNENELIPIE
jgi:hypothetical protein